MFSYLGRKTSNKVLYDVETCILRSYRRPRIFYFQKILAFFDFNIIFQVEVSLCWQWRSWTIWKSQSSVCARKVVFFFYEYFLAFESFDVNF